MKAARAAGALWLLLLLAACGQSGVGNPPPAATMALPVTAPPQCEHQRTKQRFAQIKIRLASKGGSLCIPEFRGFGGSIDYPGVDKSVVLTLRTSTKNIYHEAQLGSGTSLVYLNLRFSTNTHFGSTFGSQGGLAGSKIVSGQTYTAVGIVQVGHLALRLGPCYAIATSGPYGGVFPNLGELFSGQTITGKGFGVIEIYSGMQASEEC